MPAPTSPEERKDPPRGRPAIKSTGRGGAGNMSSSSGGADAAEYSPTRGLELAVENDTTKPLGRGGVGNILVQTRTRAAARVSGDHPRTAELAQAGHARTVAYERAVIAHTSTEASGVRTSGRGGSGNISRRRAVAQGAGPHGARPSLRLFRGKKKPKKAAAAAAGDADREDSPVRPREDAPLLPAAPRTRRIHTLLTLHRKPRAPAVSSSTTTTTTTSQTDDEADGAAPAVSARPHPRLSMLSIRTDLSSLSYTRLSRITLPPSPVLTLSALSLASHTSLLTIPAAEEGASDDEEEEDEEEPLWDAASTSTAPSSLLSDRTSPYHCVFDFPDVPPSSPPAPARLHTHFAKTHARSISTPSLPTLYEHRASGSFLELATP